MGNVAFSGLILFSRQRILHPAISFMAVSNSDLKRLAPVSLCLSATVCRLFRARFSFHACPTFVFLLHFIFPFVSFGGAGWKPLVPSPAFGCRKVPPDDQSLLSHVPSMETKRQAVPNNGNVSGGTRCSESSLFLSSRPRPEEIELYRFQTISSAHLLWKNQ